MSRTTRSPELLATPGSRRSFLRAAAATGVAAGSGGVLLTGCEGSINETPDDGNSERARTVIFDHDGGRVQSPDLWNPFVPGFRTGAGFHQSIMEPLFILDYESGQIEGWLGEKFEPNASQDLWTLTLRPGITWSDGEAFDADDVVFTLELLLEGGAEMTNAAAMQEWVKGVQQTSDLVVEFTLLKPNPRFLLDYFSVKAYSSFPIVPEHIWKGKDPLQFKNYDKAKGWPIFTGPYKLDSADPTRFVYTRRDDWWGAKAGFKPLPKPERLEWTAIETEEIRVARASDHQLDSVADLTAGAFESLKARNPDMATWLPDRPFAWTDPCTRLLSFNNALEPWNDREMRWAINYAIDREEVVRIAYEGTTTPARFFFPDYPPMQKYVDLLDAEGVFDEFPILTHDPDRAKSMIESKGYTRSGEGFYSKGGKELRLQIDAPTEYIEIWRYAQVVGEQLQRIGINATVRKLASGTWGDNIANGKFEAISDWGACGSVTEPWLSMSLYNAADVVPIGKTAAGNGIRWKNEEYTPAGAVLRRHPARRRGDQRPVRGRRQAVAA